MASSPMLQPPPGAGSPDQAQPNTPPPPADVSSAPAQPSTSVNEATQKLIKVMQLLKEISQMSPDAAPEIDALRTGLRSIGVKLMKSQSPGEPMAPPTGA